MAFLIMFTINTDQIKGSIILVRKE